MGYYPTLYYRGVVVREYLPWSMQTLKELLSSAKTGNIPAVDLELTARCSAANCIYCDSQPEVCANPSEEEVSLESTLLFLEQACKNGLHWIYTCGLGEPLEDKRFFPILDFNKAYGIKMSIFTNGQFIQNLETAKRLKESGICLILKMDTFDEEKFDYILGGKGRAKRIYRAIDLLLESGYTDTGKDGVTDLAFSIVPTTLTKDRIPEIVDYCLKHNIFPSVGELEQAGNVVTNNLFDSLGLSENGLLDVKRDSNLLDIDYRRPICPAILTGLHIDNKGNCIVDAVTGVNCKWFMLRDPQTTVIGNIETDSAEALLRKVSQYRTNAWKQNREKISEYEKVSYVFGGCGGNPAHVLDLYKETFGLK